MAGSFPQNFELLIAYIPGRQNNWAETLSCRFDYQEQVKLSHFERFSVLNTYIPVLLKFSDKSDTNHRQGLLLSALIPDILEVAH